MVRHGIKTEERPDETVETILPTKLVVTTNDADGLINISLLNRSFIKHRTLDLSRILVATSSTLCNYIKLPIGSKSPPTT